jgi:hypothetical protein
MKFASDLVVDNWIVVLFVAEQGELTEVKRLSLIVSSLTLSRYFAECWRSPEDDVEGSGDVSTGTAWSLVMFLSMITLDES